MMDCLPETEPNVANVSEEVANKVYQLRREPEKMKNAMAARGTQIAVVLQLRKVDQRR